MGRPTKLTLEVHAKVVAAIADGAYDWVAAAAAGIDDSTFRRWMQQGEWGREPYRAFRTEVRRARAQARIGAEIAVRRDNPLAWLRYGPGRERPGEPGWTQSVEGHVMGSGGGPVEFTLRIDRGDAEDTECG